MWVVPSEHIAAFDPAEAADYFSSNTEDVRSATHYDIPDDVGHM